MLFTIGLILLLTPFPSFQATTSLKRDSAGSDVRKADAALTHSKPKPAAVLNKHTVRSALKPNAVNLTALSAPVINQKPPAVSDALTAKSKLGPAVIQTTPSPAVKATTSSSSATIKDKPTGPVNRTAETKPLSTSDVKNKPASSRVQTLLSTPAKAVKEISAADDKDKLPVSANQTTVTKAQASSSRTRPHPLVDQTSAKSSSGPDVADSKDKPAPTGASDVQPTPTKSVSASGVTATKEKHQPRANETVSGNSDSVSEVKHSKHRSAPTGAPDVQSTRTKSASAGVDKGIKDKVQPSANEKVSLNSHSAGDSKSSRSKPTSTGGPDVQSNQTPTKSISASGSKITNEKSPQTGSGKSPSGSEVKPVPTGVPDVESTSTRSASKTHKDKVQSPTNETVSPSTPSSEVKLNKNKPGPTGATNLPQKSPSEVKPVPKGVPDVQSTSIRSAPKTSKDNVHPSINQTSTGAAGVQSNQTPTKSVTATGSKITKEKSPQTGSGKSPSSEGKQDTEKPVPTGAPDVQSTSTRSASKTSKDKVHPSINQTSTGAAGVQSNQTPTKSVTATGSKITKEKSPQTGSGKSPSSEGKQDTEKPVPTGAPDVQSTSTRSASKTGKDKVQSPTNETVSPSPSSSDLNLSKNKPEPTGATPTGATPTGATNPLQTGSGKTPSDSVVTQKPKKPAPSRAPEVQSTSARPGPVSNDKAIDKQTKTGGKNVTDSSTPVKPSANDTKVTKPPTRTKESSDPSQPIKVVISNDCNSGNTKQQELELQPGSPLVMTHKISLVPGGCTRECEPDMAALTQRVTQLEKEMALLKDKCPCCPDGCSGNRKCEKGKCVCRQGYEGPDCTIKNNTKEPAGTTQDGDNENTQEDQPPSNGTTGTGHKPSKPIVQTGEEKVPTQGSGLGSVKVQNISSNSFTLTWLAPKEMFKNFTVVKTELEGDDDDHEGVSEQGHQASRAKNSTEVPVKTEGTKPVVPRGKSETRTSFVVPGIVRSVAFIDLKPNTRHSLQIYGTSAEKRSKIHRVTAVTDPEAATHIVFSNVSESSLTVSWTKPKSTPTGFRVTYTNAATGESHFVTVGPRQSHAVLSKLSAGSTYSVSVTATLGRAQSDALTSAITTVPAPPTHLQVVNVTDSRAVLQWTPSLGKVDRFIVTYESSNTPNVTVTVMLSGSSVEQHLKGLQRGTVYTVRVLSQKGSLQSTAVSTTFTSANVAKASKVGPRSAVITWRTPAATYHSYRLTYQVAGKEKKEVTLEPSVTEYKLTGLLPMSRYAVLVQGQRGGHYTSLFTADFTTAKLRFPFPSECSQQRLNGALQSGEVDIYPQGKEGRAVRVYCDMETDGGGWTVFQRRMNGKTDFYRNWSDYRAGFGNLSAEFWLGNGLLRNLTSVGPVSLRVDLRSGNDTAYAHYTNFSIETEKRHYALTVSGFSGTAGDSMKYHNGRPFSTWDKNPQSVGIHCAKAYTGGWWYKNCYMANLNGRYGANKDNQGVVWIDWKGKDFSIPFTEMKFRPSAFSSATHG